ncbi:hypothetical protein GLE_0195 [Lysobacter enzymogenes]|uniref:Uncharacterized protein n=1 Tax=Lysobacter enzymogenes TaxID=69 RepID=A0A0S2DAI1_LYSEN|nr:hypothetical protein GLE_0195 [Lysobacter enzymogenes]
MAASLWRRPRHRAIPGCWRDYAFARRHRTVARYVQRLGFVG